MDRRVKNILYYTSTNKQSYNHLVKRSIKFFNKLTLDKENLLLNSKLARIKRLNQFQSFPIAEQVQFNRLLWLLRRKRKDIRQLPLFIFQPYLRDSLHENITRLLKNFYNIEHLILSHSDPRPNSSTDTREVPISLVQVHNYIRSLTSIKTLTIDTTHKLQKADHYLLAKLNSSKPLLRSLECLKFYFSGHCLTPFASKRILKYENFLHNVTHLEISLNNIGSNLAFLTKISQTLQRISSVSLLSEIPNDNSKINLDLPYSEFFTSLANINKVERLQFPIHDLLSFAKGFTPISSLKHLELNLRHASFKEFYTKEVGTVVWGLRLNGKLLNLLENNLIHQTIQSKVLQLPNISSLSLILRRDEEFLGFCFASFILRSVGNLSYLKIETEEPLHYYNNTRKETCVSISHIFEMISHLRPTLKTLIINTTKSCWNHLPILVLNSDKIEDFACLSCIRIGNMQIAAADVAGVEQICKLVQEVPGVSADGYSIHLTDIRLDSSQAFGLFMRSLRKINGGGGVKILLELNLLHLECDSIAIDLVNLVRSGSGNRGNRNISLTLLMHAKEGCLAAEIIEKNLKVQRMFEKLTVSIKNWKDPRIRTYEYQYGQDME